MIEIVYPNGMIKRFDALPEGATRKLFIASFMTPAEMAKMFDGSEAIQAAVSLGIKKPKSEAAACAAIYKHFHG